MILIEPNTPARQAATNGLAIVGFIALVILGVSLAVYSARFVPEVVNRIGAAAVYLGSVFTPAPESSLVVVPNGTTTPPLTATTTPPATTTTPVTTAPAPSTPRQPVPTTPGTPTSGTYPIGGSTSTPALHGLSDLIVTIDAVGYLTSVATDSFVASSTVPVGSRPAVKFTIKNIGTNQAGAWRFSASIPTRTSYIYNSQLQQSLLPGDSIEYTLGFDQPRTGSNQTILVTANPDHLIGESNTNNNSASANLTIVGG